MNTNLIFERVGTFISKGTTKFCVPILFLFLFNIFLVSADLGYKDNTKPKLEAPKSTAITSSINYSTVNVNNSDTLDGYHAKAFWDAMIGNNSKWTSTYNSSYNSIIGNYWDFGSNQGLGGGTKSGSYTLQTTGTGNQFQDLLVGEGGQYQEANRGQFDVHHFIGVDSVTPYSPYIVTGSGNYDAINCYTNEYYVYAYKDINGQRIYSSTGAYFMVDEYGILMNANPSFQCGVDSVPYTVTLDWDSVGADGYIVDAEYDYLMSTPAYYDNYGSNTITLGTGTESLFTYQSPVVVTPKSVKSDFYISNTDGTAYQNGSIEIEQIDNSKSAVSIKGHDNGGTIPPSKIGYLTWTSQTSGNMLGALDGDNDYGNSGTINLYGSKLLSSRIGTYGITDRSTATQGVMVMDYNDGNYASIFPNQYVLALVFGGNVPTTRGLTLTNLGEVRVGSSGNFTAPDVKVGNVRIRNNKVYYGASAQASETYNGTDFVINPKEVGSGGAFVLGDFNVQKNFTVGSTATFNESINITGNNALVLSGVATVYEDISAPFTVAHVGATAPSFNENEKAYGFADGTNEAYVFASLQLPHSYRQGSNIGCHLHVRPDGTQKNNVTFEMNYSWINIGEVNTSSLLSTVSQNFTSGVAYNNTIISFPSLIGTGKTISSTLNAKITRRSNAASDTYTGTVYVDFFDCHYEMDTLGSRTEYAK